MDQLTVACTGRGRYEEAKRLSAEAWERRCRKFGENHPDTLESLHDFGVMYLEQGRYKDAGTKVLASYEGRSSKPGPAQPL